MPVPSDTVVKNLQWLMDMGTSREDLAELNPCVPGEFTMPGACYINTGSPGIFYLGTEEGTLPLVAGRWYLIPTVVIERNPRLPSERVSVARAPALIR